MFFDESASFAVCFSDVVGNVETHSSDLVPQISISIWLVNHHTAVTFPRMSDDLSYFPLFFEQIFSTTQLRNESTE